MIWSWYTEAGTLTHAESPLSLLHSVQYRADWAGCPSSTLARLCRARRNRPVYLGSCCSDIMTLCRGWIFVCPLKDQAYSVSYIAKMPGMPSLRRAKSVDVNNCRDQMSSMWWHQFFVSSLFVDTWQSLTKHPWHYSSLYLWPKLRTPHVRAGTWFRRLFDH